MYFSISDNLISEFLSGLIVVFSLLGVGAMLMLLTGALAKKFPFCRLSLVLALTPLSLIRFLERDANSTLFLYGMIALLLGITIDGINHLLTPRTVSIRSEKDSKERVPEAAKEEEEPKPGMIVWEKAE